MEAIKGLLIPITIGIVSALVAALITIKIKYASSEADALAKLKVLGITILYFCWVVWLIYDLGRELISAELVTRKSVFSIAVDTVSLAILVIMYFFNRFEDFLLRMLELHSRHSEITRSLLKIQKETIKRMSPPNTDKS